MKTKSEIDYINRVKEYIDLDKVKTRSDLSIQMSKAGLLGKYRQTRQLNIISDEIDFKRFEVREQIRISKVTSKQTITRYKKPVIIYRDNKGRFKKHVR